ncbi:MAG: hypothetical protein HPY70_07375 [Firmicutes bacterium]|nr:hypothetical protein [Bacillota bacterium]
MLWRAAGYRQHRRSNSLFLGKNLSGQRTEIIIGRLFADDKISVFLFVKGIKGILGWEL